MATRWGATRRARTLDIAIATVLLVLNTVGVVVRSQVGPRKEAVHGAGFVAFFVVAGVVAFVPLVWRRRSPLLVWALSGTATFAAMVFQATPGLLGFAPLIALYTVATISPRRISLAAGALTIVGVTIGVGAGNAEALGWEKFVFPIVVVVACWLIGDNLRVRRAYVAELEAKAEHAEADRLAESARAASRERARIARELHDVAVHHVSVIAVQAGAARMLAEQAGTSDDSTRVLAAIEGTARQALDELRQILGVLRHDSESERLAPQPGLRQLDELIGEVRGAGLPVEVEVEGDAASLPAALDLSAYRIVQEALTNVLKHEGRVPTRVSVRYRSSELEIEVTNQGAPNNSAPHPSGGGHGLAGMRERVAMFGGRLDADSRPGGGFSVIARLPVGAASP